MNHNVLIHRTPSCRLTSCEQKLDNRMKIANHVIYSNLVNFAVHRCMLDRGSISRLSVRRNGTEVAISPSQPPEHNSRYLLNQMHHDSISIGPIILCIGQKFSSTTSTTNAHACSIHTFKWMIARQDVSFAKVLELQ